MVRIAGINIPINKKIYISLTYIYGIGKYSSLLICKKSGINPYFVTSKLSEYSIRSIRKTIDSLYSVEGDLRSEISINIKNLIDINSYRGIRHVKKLPVRGQRTHTNARTRKGKKNPIASKKKASK